MLKEELGAGGDVLPRIGTAFGAGFGRADGTCGVVSGVLMGIGLLLGRDGPEGDKEPAYAAARRFVEGFRERFGGTACTAVIGHDLSRPEGRRAARAADALTTRCVPAIAWAARHLAGLLERHRPA